MADQPTVICSAVSEDMLNWQYEEGVRLQTSDKVGGPRFLKLPDGRGRLYCFCRMKKNLSDGTCWSGNDLISGISSDGINFELEPQCRFSRDRTEFASLGITAAEVVAPANAGDNYVMVYSEWQDAPVVRMFPRIPALIPMPR